MSESVSEKAKLIRGDPPKIYSKKKGEPPKNNNSVERRVFIYFYNSKIFLKRNSKIYFVDEKSFLYENRFEKRSAFEQRPVFVFSNLSLMKY